MSLPYRCGRCRARRSLPRRLERYVRPPRCRSCGHQGLYLDRYRLTSERARGGSYRGGQDPARRERVCACDGYWFPHRRGSLRCQHYQGARDLEWEPFLRDLGLTTSEPAPASGGAPF